MSDDIVDAETGEVLQDCVLDSSRLSQMTIDELVDMYQRELAIEQSARNVRMQLAAALAARSPREGECRTTRLRGEQRRVKLEYPADTWDQRELKALWYAYPKYREQYLALDRIRVQSVEVKKLKNERGDLEFEEFKRELMEANRGPVGMVRVVIEE